MRVHDVTLLQAPFSGKQQQQHTLDGGKKRHTGETGWGLGQNGANNLILTSIKYQNRPKLNINNDTWKTKTYELVHNNEYVTG